MIILSCFTFAVSAAVIASLSAPGVIRAVFSNPYPAQRRVRELSPGSFSGEKAKRGGTEKFRFAAPVDQENGIVVPFQRNILPEDPPVIPAEKDRLFSRSVPAYDPAPRQTVFHGIFLPAMKDTCLGKPLKYAVFKGDRGKRTIGAPLMYAVELKKDQLLRSGELAVPEQDITGRSADLRTKITVVVERGMRLVTAGCVSQVRPLLFFVGKVSAEPEGSRR